MRSLGSDESEIRERNELADSRDEPVYSRPTFPSGTSNLNSSHPRTGHHPHQVDALGPPQVGYEPHLFVDIARGCTCMLYIPVHTAIALSSTFSSSSSSLLPPSEIARRSSSFRKSPGGRIFERAQSVVSCSERKKPR